MKIEIQIEDSKNFTDVALVVDQVEFLQEIIELRKIYSVKELWTYKKYKDFYREIYLNKDKRKKLEDRIESVRKKLRLSYSFLRVIQMSTFCNKITDKDYLPAFLSKENGSFDIEGNEPDDKYYIVLSPLARDKDVIIAFQEYRDKVANWMNNKVSGYKFAWIPNNKLVKSKPSIKDHRQWYQSFNSGMSFNEIEIECINSCPLKVTQPAHKTGVGKPPKCRCFDESTIRKGVENYKSLLWKSRTL